MDYINAAAAYGLASYQAAAQVTGAVWRAATSKTAQRTLVTTVLFGAVSALMFGVACLAYLTFYQRFMPSQVMKLPMHLQYGYVLIVRLRALPGARKADDASDTLPTHTPSSTFRRGGRSANIKTTTSP